MADVSKITLDMIRSDKPAHERRTKIVCTLGPACWDVPNLGKCRTPSLCDPAHVYLPVCTWCKERGTCQRVMEAAFHAYFILDPLVLSFHASNLPPRSALYAMHRGIVPVTVHPSRIHSEASQGRHEHRAL